MDLKKNIVVTSLILLTSCGSSDKISVTAGKKQSVRESLLAREFTPESSRSERRFLLDITSETTTTSTSTTLAPRINKPKPKSASRPRATVAPSVAITPAASVPQTTTESSGNCIGRTMTNDEAHACFDQYLYKYPWNVAKAFRIMMCESTGKTTAQNGHHWGLFQLDTGPYWDAATNISVAYNHYYVPRGWQPWQCQ